LLLFDHLRAGGCPFWDVRQSSLAWSKLLIFFLRRGGESLAVNFDDTTRTGARVTESAD
jgi:hypothetical protein